MSVTSVRLYESEGTGAFNSWDDHINLTKRANGSYYISLRRYGIDTPGSSTLYQSGPFRRASRLVDILEEIVESSWEWFPAEWSSPSDVLVMLAKVVEFDPPLAAAAIAEVARRLASAPAPAEGQLPGGE